MNNPNQSVILVGGTGRCGTTILNRVLEEHPETVVSPPLRFMIDPDGVFPFLNMLDHSWSPYAADVGLKRMRDMFNDLGTSSIPNGLLKKLRNWQKWFGRNIVPRYAHHDAVRFCPDYPMLVEKLIQDLTDFSYEAHWIGTRFMETHQMLHAGPGRSGKALAAVGAFYAGYVDAALKKYDARYFVDRNTWNHLWLERFLEINPNVKLLHIYRDPRDVTASYMHQTWMPKGAIQAAKAYQDLMDQWWQVRSRVPETSYMELSLEELTIDTRKTLEKVSEFIEMEFNETMLDVKLNKAHRDRWRKDIPADQVAEVEKILSPTLEAHGYRD